MADEPQETMILTNDVANYVALHALLDLTDALREFLATTGPDLLHDADEAIGLVDAAANSKLPDDQRSTFGDFTTRQDKKLRERRRARKAQS